MMTLLQICWWLWEWRNFDNWSVFGRNTDKIECGGLRKLLCTGCKTFTSANLFDLWWTESRSWWHSWLWALRCWCCAFGMSPAVIISRSIIYYAKMYEKLKIVYGLQSNIVQDIHCAAINLMHCCGIMFLLWTKKTNLMKIHRNARAFNLLNLPFIVCAPIRFTLEC